MKRVSGRLLATALILVVFLGGAVSIFGYLLNGAGVRVPLLQDEPYRVVVMTEDADNLVRLSAVRIAGVPVGRVSEVVAQGAGQPAKVVFTLEDDVAPLHEGARVRFGLKSVLGESYLDVEDGPGKALPSGTRLEKQAVSRSTQVGDLLASFDPQTRESLGGMVRSLDEGTQGTKQDIGAVLTGLGDLGREGHTALDAVAAQSEDLRALARETTVLLQALDTGEGKIATMVTNAQRLTEATAGQRPAIESTMRQLPGVLATAETATESVTELSGSLAPVTADLNAAAPFLTTALNELPPTTADLRGLLPALDGTLVRAPATLERVPTFGGDVRSTVPEARSVLRDVNPALTYLAPYGLDFASFVANFSAAMAYTDESGNNYLRLTPKLNELSVESPVPLKGTTGTYTNPFPPAGNGGADQEFTGEYPRLERAPR